MTEVADATCLSLAQRQIASFHLLNAKIKVFACKTAGFALDFDEMPELK